MVDKNYVRYKNRYKKKAPSRINHLEKFKWKKGQSGNPDGRPTGSISLVERLKAHLRRHPEDVENIIQGLVALGIDPSASQLGAIKEMMDRVDGKVTETHKIEGELPIRIEFVPALELLGAKTEEDEHGGVGA